MSNVKDNFKRIIRDLVRGGLSDEDILEVVRRNGFIDFVSVAELNRIIQSYR